MASEYIKQESFYNRWRFTPEAGEIGVRPPADFRFIYRADLYPKNFVKVRDAFRLAYITHKMLDQ